nr:hypothetical protein [Tanacetum cinerariifolium]
MAAPPFSAKAGSATTPTPKTTSRSSTALTSAPAALIKRTLSRRKQCARPGAQPHEPAVAGARAQGVAAGAAITGRAA